MYDIILLQAALGPVHTHHSKISLIQCNLYTLLNAYAPLPFHLLPALANLVIKGDG
jgi:hypothetical protein